MINSGITVWLGYLGFAGAWSFGVTEAKIR